MAYKQGRGFIKSHNTPDRPLPRIAAWCMLMARGVMRMLHFTVDNLGVDTVHRASFCHELPNGFPFWVYVQANTPMLLNMAGSETFLVEAGTCVLYPPDCPRYVYCPKGQECTSNNWIHFSCSDDEALKEILRQYRIPIQQFFTLRQFMPVTAILQELIYERNTEQMRKDIMCSLLIEQMLLQISRNILPLDKKTDSSAMAHLHTFELLRKQLYATPEREWSVKDMAGQVYLGANQFINLYRCFFSVTPKQDLIHARIAKAKTLLSSRVGPNEAAITLRDVALLCGFKNEYYFSSAFKKVTGIPPGQYVPRRDI